MNKTIQLHSAQTQMFARIRNFIDSDSKRAVTVAPPGFGKTAVITSAFDYIASKFNNQTRRHKHQFVGVSLMLTPRLMLNEQQKNEIEGMHIQGMMNVRKKVRVFDCLNGLSIAPIHEFIAECQETGEYPVIVSTYKSCGKLKDFKFDLIMCDEGHNVTSQEVFSDVMENLDPDAKRIFMTATPKINAGEVKGNTRGMGNKKFYGDFIYTMSFSQAVRNGFILPIRRLFIDTYGESEKSDAHIVDTVIKTMNRMKQAMGDSPLPNKVIYVFNTEADIEIITKNWEKICLETGATVFTAVSKKNNFCVNGSRPNGQGDARERFISEFKKTKSDCILAHIDTMGEGIDVPGITGCILFGAGDVVRIIQNIGRAMRVLASDRELKKSDRIKKVALLGMVSYNGETSGQEFLSSIARAMREMSSDDFYKKFLSFQFNNRGASKSQPDDVGGGTGNYLAEHQMDLAGFDATIEDDTPLFDDGDCPPDEIIALDVKMVQQEEQERRQQEQEKRDAEEQEHIDAAAERMRKMWLMMED